MTKTYDRNLSGALFKNDKAGVEARPDYTGSCEIAGVQYWLSAWVKTSKAGEKFMSLSFKLKDAAKAQPQTASRAEPEFDDAIPF